MGKKSVSASVEVQSAKVADSATKLKESSVRIEDSADRRTELASNRTALAAERTYSAWIRTGLFALASGAGAKGVLTGLMPAWIIMVNGSALIAFSIFCYVAAVWRFTHSGAARPAPDVPRVDARILTAMSGLLSIISLLALAGLWLDK
jgi:putative membrane protein